MEIKLQYSGSESMRNQTIQQIIVGAVRCLRAFVKIYKEATPAAIQEYFRNNGDTDVGDVPEELFLEHLDSILSDIDIATLLNIDRNVGHLGSKAPVEKYWVAVEYFSVLVEDMKQHIAAYDTYTTNSLKELRDNIKDYIGDLTYALACNAFDPYTNIDILETDEKIICDQQLTDALAVLYPGDANAVVTFAKELADLQDEFVISAPIADLDPSAWQALINSCTPDISMQLADYDKYITTLDIRAFTAGILSIDESFIDTLIERKNSVDFMGNVLPNTWANFVKLVPQELFTEFYNNELYISQDEVKECVESGFIPKDFFKNVAKRTTVNSADGDKYDYTKLFGSKNNL